jgi:hypothetical protein
MASLFYGGDDDGLFHPQAIANQVGHDEAIGNTGPPGSAGVSRVTLSM